MTGRVQHQQLELADTAHQLADRGQAAGRAAQLAMHGRQRRKDRRELTRYAANVFARCSEEEFDAVARIADAAQQVFDAVHGAQATRAPRSTQVRDAPRACD
jgi:hypothetical protein